MSKDHVNNINDEAEDTLSLSDLATSYNATEWADYFSRESQSSSSMSSSMDQELQEEEYFEFFSEEWSTTIPENIIFCGKLIPSKTPLIKNNKDSQLHNKKSKNSLSLSNSFSHRRRRQRSSSEESKWHTLLLSTARILTGGMELKDIKTRQSRQGPLAAPLVENINSSHHEVNVYRKRNKGLRGLIRALGCGDYLQTTNIKDSIKTTPRAGAEYLKKLS